MRVGSIMLRILREFIRDKRSIALLFLAPLFILTLLKFVLTGETSLPKINVIGMPAEVVEKLKTEIDLSEKPLEQAKEDLRKATIDAIIQVERNQWTIELEGSDPSANQAVLTTLQKVLQQEQLHPSVKLKVSYLHGSEDMTPFDHYGPILISFFSFFFVFLLAGVSFLRERTSGTLERLLATPIKRSEIVFGYILGFGIMMLIQVCFVTWFALQILELFIMGSFWYVLLIMLLLSLTALTMGTLLSAYANNELQMVQFIPIVIVPQFIFSGLFDLESMGEVLNSLSTIMPLRYGADALVEIMLRGKGWSEIATNVLVLIGFVIVLTILNMVTLRKYRKV